MMFYTLRCLPIKSVTPVGFIALKCSAHFDKEAIFSFHSEVTRMLFPWICHEVLRKGNLK